jgi:type I restriction enzyme R subunit
MINEEQVELLAIDWFKELGYDYLLGYEISPDSQNPQRKSYEDVLLFDRLKNSLIKLNSNIPLLAIEDAIDILRKPQQASLVQNNRAFHQMILQGISVDIKKDDETKGDVVKLIDFENFSNNDFDCIDKIDNLCEILDFINFETDTEEQKIS